MGDMKRVTIPGYGTYDVHDPDALSGTDTTLSVADKAADAAAVGTAIRQLSSDIGGLTAEKVGARPNTWLPTLKEMGISELGTYFLSIPAGGTFRFRVESIFLMMGRVDFAYVTNAVYVITAYSTMRAPSLTELSVGTNITVVSGGDNDNGWYVDIVNGSTTSATVYFIGAGRPIPVG